MKDPEVDEFLRGFAPGDVRDTIAWLCANGYTLRSHRGDGTFGAEFVYIGEAKVLITVDRSQWMLDIAPRPDAEAWQFDLLIAAQAGRPYVEVFPVPGTRSDIDPLPEQLPDGVSWRETLPGILQWVEREGVRVAVDRARDERSRLMWPHTRER